MDLESTAYPAAGNCPFIYLWKVFYSNELSKSGIGPDTGYPVYPCTVYIKCNQSTVFNDKYNQSTVFSDKYNQSTVFNDNDNQLNVCNDKYNHSTVFNDKYNQSNVCNDKYNHSTAFSEIYNQSTAFSEIYNQSTVFNDKGAPDIRPYQPSKFRILVYRISGLEQNR